jgi:phage baseplate assembly protein V
MGCKKIMKIDDILKIFSRAIRPLQRKVLLMVGHGIIEAVKDGGDLQFIQATFLADETKNDVRKMHHFGFSSSPPEGTECIAVSVAGNRESSVIIATENREFRFKNLGDGEVAVYSKSGDFIHFKKDNEIEISTKKLIINSADEVTVNTETANVNAAAAANITSPTTTIDGDLVVTGEVTAEKSVTVTENVVATADVTGANVVGLVSAGAPSIAAALSLVVSGSELKDYETHTHSYQDDNGSGTTSKNTAGVN